MAASPLPGACEKKLADCGGLATALDIFTASEELHLEIEMGRDPA
jgi:hypothetical protein